MQNMIAVYNGQIYYVSVDMGEEAGAQEAGAQQDPNLFAGCDMRDLLRARGYKGDGTPQDMLEFVDQCLLAATDGFDRESVRQYFHQALAWRKVRDQAQRLGWTPKGSTSRYRALEMCQWLARREIQSGIDYGVLRDAYEDTKNELSTAETRLEEARKLVGSLASMWNHTSFAQSVEISRVMPGWCGDLQKLYGVLNPKEGQCL